MPSLEYFLVAESVSVDASTGRVSIFQVLEELQSDQFPFHQPQMVAISSWNIDPGEERIPLQLTLRVHSPEEGTRPTEFQMILEQSPKRRRRSFMGLVGFPFTRPGTWRMEVLANDTHYANHQIVVTQAEARPG